MPREYYDDEAEGYPGDYGSRRSPHRDRERGPPPGPRGMRPRRDEKTSLLVRNIPRDSRPEDLRSAFERFGPIKDVYLPRDFYSGEPRGFGFVQYVSAEDADDAQYEMDRTMFQGREITVVFAEENRKKPDEMRTRESRGYGYGSRRSPPRGARGSGGGYDYSPSPPRRRSRSPPRRRRTPSPPPPGYDEGDYDPPARSARPRARNDEYPGEQHREGRDEGGGNAPPGAAGNEY